MSSGRRRCDASMPRNRRTGIEAWRRCGWRYAGSSGDQGPAGCGNRERHISRGASGCSGWDSHYEVAQNAGYNRLHPSRLAIRRAPGRIVLSSLRADGPPLGIDCDRLSQRGRLGFREGTGPRGFCHLTSRQESFNAGRQTRGSRLSCHGKPNIETLVLDDVNNLVVRMNPETGRLAKRGYGTKARLLNTPLFDSSRLRLGARRKIGVGYEFAPGAPAQGC